MTQKDSRQERLNIQADAQRRKQEAFFEISKGRTVESVFDKIALIDENSRLRLELLEIRAEKKAPAFRFDLAFALVGAVLGILLSNALF